MKRLRALWAQHAGQGSIEYLGMVVAVVTVGLVIIGGMPALSNSINDGLQKAVCTVTGPGCGGGAPGNDAAGKTFAAKPMNAVTPGSKAQGGDTLASEPAGGGTMSSTQDARGQLAGDQIVPGLGKRKAELEKLGITTKQLGAAMLENHTLSTNYAFGDNKTGDSANYGIFKQNWGMIRDSNPDLAALAKKIGQDAVGAKLNADPAADLKALRNSQKKFGSTWAAGHRNGDQGFKDPNSDVVKNYKSGTDWITKQIEKNPKDLKSDRRFWVQVQAI